MPIIHKYYNAVCYELKTFALCCPQVVTILINSFAPIREKQEILKLRMVCRRWMKSVDKCLEAFPSLQPYSAVVNYHLTNSLYFNSGFMCGFSIHLKGLEAIRQFEGKIESNLTRNPVIGRHLIISSSEKTRNNIEEYERFFQCVHDLLKKVGHYLWYLELVVNYNNVNCSSLYSNLNRCLCLLPNLRSLELTASTLELRTLESKAQLRNQLDITPLAEIATLQTLKLNIFNFPPELERILFMNYGKTLKTVSLNVLLPRHIYVHEYFYCLNELSVSSVESLDLISKLLSNLAKANAPLQKFEGYEGNSINVFRILKLLTVFPIKEVVLFGEDMVEIKELRTILSLRVLKIVDSRYLTYEFLENLPNLEYFYVGKDRNYREKHESLLGCTQIMRDCLYCNKSPPESFWKSLPFLRHVYVNETIYNGASPEYVYSRYNF